MEQTAVLAEIISFAMANYVRTWALFDLIKELHPEIDTERLNALIDQRRETLSADLGATGWNETALISLIARYYSGDLKP